MMTIDLEFEPQLGHLPKLRHASHDQSSHGNWATGLVKAYDQSDAEDLVRGESGIDNSFAFGDKNGDPEAYEAWRGYVHLDYRMMNDPLRARARGESGVDFGGEEGDINALTEYLENREAFIPEDILVYRGMDNYVMSDFRVGDRFQDHGFTSTSFSSELARSFGKHVMRIKIPAESKGIIGNPEEYEVILQRGSTFELLNQTTSPGGDTIWWDVELVSQVYPPPIPEERVGADE